MGTISDRAVNPRLSHPKEYCKRGHLLAETRRVFKHSTRCSTCAVMRTAEWRTRNPNYVPPPRKTAQIDHGEYDAEKRRTRTLATYGLTPVEYSQLLAGQEERCAICGTRDWKGPGRKPHVDHDHSTGKVRGLLCVDCNALLGRAHDNPEVLAKAIAYLGVG